MGAISSIVSRLTLDTAQFNTKLQRSRRRAKSWGKDLSRIGKQVGKAVAAGTAVAAIGLSVMTAKQLESIDTSAKFARSIDLQVDKLAGLRHAGDLNGISNDQFDKSLQRMVRSIGDANMMGGTLQRVFDDLGVSSEDLARKSPDEQIAILADAFAEVEGRTQAASKASAIFGRQGTAMLNVLSQGRGVFASAQAEIEAYGGAFSAIDAAAVEEANDQIARMKLRLNGVQQEIAIGLAPYLTSITDQVIGLKVEGVEAADVIGGGLEFVAKAIAAAVNTVDVFKLAWKTLRSAMQANITLIVQGVVKISDAVEAVAGVLGFDYETPDW